MEIINKVKNTNLINHGDRLVLGLSGGSDSMCLLNVLLNLREEYKLNIVAVHINHMIREESDEDEPFLRKVSSVSLAPGKSVQIVTLVDKGFIVGVSEDSVNLISEINDKELIDAMNLYSDKKKQTQKPRSFADVLEIFMPRKKDTNIYDDSSKKFTDMLNKQRDRLQDGE